MIEVTGWIGSFLLSTCGLPLVIDIYKKKSVKNLSFPFIVWWFVGEILLLIYVGLQDRVSWPLIFNYGFNIVCLLILFWFYFLYRKEKKIK